MSNKQFMFAVSFDPSTSRFKVEGVQNWIGEPVYDFADEQLRWLESDSETNLYDGLEDVLQMGIGHINNIFATNGVSFDKGM